MKITVAYNKAKKGIELFSSEEFPNELKTFLRELGFKESLSNSKMWYVDDHPAYKNYVTSLSDVFTNKGDWKTIKVHPSFSSSLENIDINKFSVVKIYYSDKGVTKKQDYVLFDSYKKVALEIATQFAINTYGENFKRLEVFPRNYKRLARSLFSEGKIITAEAPVIKEDARPKLASHKEEVEQETDNLETKGFSLTEIVEETETSNFKATLTEVIETFLSLEEQTTGESETIIGSTLFDLEAALEERDQEKSKALLIEAITDFKLWVTDLDKTSKMPALTSMNKLTPFVGAKEISIEEEKEVLKAKSIAKDIFVRDHMVRNVLVPAQAGEPFQSGSITIGDTNHLKVKFPQLYKINGKDLKMVSPLVLFQLSQMAHPTDYDISINRSEVLNEWENRGFEAFETFGYPTDLDYPYVNIYTGYNSVKRLGDELYSFSKTAKWWAVVEHARPIADLALGISILDEKLMELVDKELEIINPKTGKPKTNKKSKDAYNDITWNKERLERSKHVIQNYLNKDVDTEHIKLEEPLPKKETKKNNDYLDRVIAIMHTSYANKERLSKKKIEALKKQINVPNLGALWEAVELSWLLWYKQIYNEPIPFETRLHKMDAFWQKGQPTYAYSDSSKELYKQYSTPCPIGAIIAEYTGMKDAEFIFEPSAGNGLLVIGANPRRTHVNEIDTSRKQSLEHQGFGKITTNNAAEPFPETMTKVHNVVVTNPPFAKWEADAFDKERIIQKYFHKHRGLAHHIRLEHLMSGLALHTMVDNGKAAIIIMGHVYFEADGLVAKYRPFFNWLYRHYHVDDIININSYKLYNKQGAVAKTMLILINGRKAKPQGVAPNQTQAPHLDKIVDTFFDLWKRVKHHINPNIDTLIKQLKIAKTP